jgi:hypothetical protein
MSENTMHKPSDYLKVDEMYPDVGVDQLIYSAADDVWPFVNDVSSVTIVTSASDWIPIGSEFIIKQYQSE